MVPENELLGMVVVPHASYNSVGLCICNSFI
jgi:hypothetical protein